MSEVIKDSAIKLFGKTISLPPPDKLVSDDASRYSSLASSTSQDSKDESTEEYESSNPSEEKSPDKSENSKKEEAKKPDKIIPCPRCNSMDTKFCYFNNYNVKQPRHFCKKCQRYWTCGGTMRNVAVGSGRRKTKNALAPNYHSVMVPDTDAFVFSPHGFPLRLSFYPAAFYCSTPSVLGKHLHSRENLDGVLVPKTLRIHDPSEAAKSDGVGSFESKDDMALLLRANPAAFSRSLNFHERA